MRDIIDHHEREMMLDLTGERRPVPEMGRAGPAEAAEGGPAVQTHAGACESRIAAGGPATATEADREIVTGASLLRPENWRALMTVWRLQRESVSKIYDWLEREMAEAAKAGPMPLASGEPWAEGDGAYAVRMDVRCTEDLRHAGSDEARLARARTLDKWGERYGFPRARLVPVEGWGMGEHNTTSAVLKRASVRVADPLRWVKISTAVDRRGRDVLPTDAAACRWCLIGAVQAECDEDHETLMRCYDALDRAAIMSGYRPPMETSLRACVAFNDDKATTHAMVIDVMQRALRLAQRTE